MFDKLSDNLNHLMAKMPISADELARRTGLPASTIKKIRNRYNPNPTLTTLLPLARFFSITLGQLIGEEPLSTTPIENTGSATVAATHSLPVITWKDAITWPHCLSHPIHFLSTSYQASNNTFALIVEDDDWSYLAKGTALLVDPALKLEHRDLVIVHKEGLPLPTLKQAIYDEGEIYLKSMLPSNNVSLLTAAHTLLGVVFEYKMCLKD